MRRLGSLSFERMRSITADAPRSLAGLAINAAEAAFSAMGRKGPAQANAWQANRRRAARYPRCIPRAHAMGVTIDGKRAFLCHIWLLDIFYSGSQKAGALLSLSCTLATGGLGVCSLPSMSFYLDGIGGASAPSALAPNGHAGIPK